MKTQEEYAREIDEIVLRDVESCQAVAWYVVFSSGLTGTGNKHIGDMVRAVIDF